MIFSTLHLGYKYLLMNDQDKKILSEWHYFSSGEERNKIIK